MKYDLEIKDLGQSLMEIRGELSVEDFSSFQPLVIKQLNAETDLPGFRKNHIPEKVLISKIGEEKILFAMAEQAIKSLYPIILAEKKIEAIGMPEIQITKLASGNPLGFIIKTAIIPSFPLPDYLDLAHQALKKINTLNASIAVSDKETDDFIDNLRRMDHNQSAKNITENPEAKPVETNLPEINDDFVKKFGDFKSVEEFRNKIKDQLLAEKKITAKEKARVTILEAIALKIEMVWPVILLEHELNKMIAELKSQVEPMGIKFENYLTHLKKTEGELREAWRGDAEKRVKFGLIIQKIAVDAKIIISQSEIESYTKQMLDHHPDKDKIKPEDLHYHAENVLMNDKVFVLLEKSGE